VLRVNEATELPDDLVGTVGVTAGASAPDELVEAVVARLAPTNGVEEVHVTDEDEYFPPPPELRDLLRGLAAALAVGLAAPAPTDAPAPGVVGLEAGSADSGAALGDRHVSAADVLARLAG
jgi:4-hydroxy-3-methylbut-2-enyl diphosphate reductase